MSKRMRELFEQARRDGRKLFIPYITAGYPTMRETVPFLLAAEAGGADIIELGVPFTDPLADGATIQHANTIALEHGISVQGCFDIVRGAGRGSGPIVLNYYPLYARRVKQAPTASSSSTFRRRGRQFHRRLPRQRHELLPLVIPPAPATGSGAAGGRRLVLRRVGTTGGKTVDSGDAVRFTDPRPYLPAAGGGLRHQQSATGRYGPPGRRCSQATAYIATIDAAGKPPRRASGSLWRMVPARSGQVTAALRRDNERRWAWRWPFVGRAYDCPPAAFFFR
jgi:hypothetical protein